MDGIDERKNDEARIVHEEVGVVFFLGRHEGLKFAGVNPTLSCDGTFSIVSSSDNDQSFELNTIVSKYICTGKASQQRYK